jgi:urate oxidase
LRVARLGPNRYGKARVRLVKLERRAGLHVLRDVTVAIALEGDFESAHTRGDNRGVLPTDTMKNTVYALAREHLGDAVEDFALQLGRHFLGVRSAQGEPLTAHVTRAAIRINESMWSRIPKDGKPHPYAFLSAGTEQRIARVMVGRERTTVFGGINDLLVLKTAGSAFEGYPKDPLTTLPETSDRIFATAVRAVWRYTVERPDYSVCWQRARRAILETFADHDSRSVQHTLYAMGEAVLAACSEIEEVRFTLPNRHHIPIDLSPFGMRNQNDIFVATREPYGLIEGVVRR